MASRVKWAADSPALRVQVARLDQIKASMREWLTTLDQEAWEELMREARKQEDEGTTVAQRFVGTAATVSLCSFLEELVISQEEE